MLDLRQIVVYNKYDDMSSSKNFLEVGVVMFYKVVFRTVTGEKTWRFYRARNFVKLVEYLKDLDFLDRIVSVVELKRCPVGSDYKDIF